MELQEVRVLAEGLAFPEGPVAMPDGSVIVTEIRAGRLSRVGPNGAVSTVADLGGGPNGAAIGPDGAIYVCNNGGQMSETKTTPAIQRVDPETGEADVLFDGCDGQPLGAPNDLVFDETGGFWFSDITHGAILYARADGSSICRADIRAFSPNGVGLSPGGDVLYWAETLTRQVHRRRLNGPGQIVPSPGGDIVALELAGSVDPWTILVGLPGAAGFDSLAVEDGGAVCVATLIDSGITVIDPENGSYVRHTLPEHLADPVVTNICFGGTDLQTAYITCSRTGRLISCQWPHPGLRLAFQALPERTTV